MIRVYAMRALATRLCGVLCCTLLLSACGDGFESGEAETPEAAPLVADAPMLLGSPTASPAVALPGDSIALAVQADGSVGVDTVVVDVTDAGVPTGLRAVLVPRTAIRWAAELPLPAAQAAGSYVLRVTLSVTLPDQSVMQTVYSNQPDHSDSHYHESINRLIPRENGVGLQLLQSGLAPHPIGRLVVGAHR